MNNRNVETQDAFSDTMSLEGESKGFRYEMVEWESIIFEHDLNPFSKHAPSKSFLNNPLIDKYEGILERVGPIHPLVVFDHSEGYTYLGPLELYYAYERIVKKVKSKLYVHIAILPRETSKERIIEASVLLNPDENIPDQLYRLKRLKHLVDLGRSNAEVKKILNVGKSNGAFATQVGRDLSITRNPIALELTAGITPDDNPLQLPNPLKAKISYSTALELDEKLGKDLDLWKRYKELLTLWIEKTKGCELPTDVSTPIYKRKWYKNERDKPLKIALELLDEQYKGVKNTNINISDFKPWEIAVTDSNVRILKIPSASIDLKNKNFNNMKLIFDIAYKMELVSQSLNSYLGLITPVEHGGNVRGHASTDDKTIELRSNLSEFDGYNYASFIFSKKAIKYSDRYRLLKSLNLSFKTFGFKNSKDIKSIKSIRASFNKWDRENAYKIESSLELFKDLGSTLSRQVIYKKLKECILELDATDDREIDFETFFMLVFTRSFKMWQDEYEMSKREAKTIQVGAKIKKFRQKMRKKRTIKKKIQSKKKIRKGESKLRIKPIKKKGVRLKKTLTRKKTSTRKSPKKKVSTGRK